MCDRLDPPHGARLLSAVDELVASGVLREELLPLLWCDAGLKASDYAAVLSMLEETGVLFRISNTDGNGDGGGISGDGGGGGGADGGAQRAIAAAVSGIYGSSYSSGGSGSSSVGGGGQRWVMPMRLPLARPVEIPSSWHHQLYRKREGEVSVCQACGLGSFVPPGLIERLLAVCYRLGTHRRLWRRGCILSLDLSGDALKGSTSQGSPASSHGSHGSEGAARLIVDVESVAVAEAVAVAGGEPLEEGEVLAASEEVIVATTTTAKEEGGKGECEVEEAACEAARDYSVRFEAFGPPACEARLTAVVGVAVKLMRGLMRDFPGLIAPSALPSAAGDERGPHLAFGRHV